MTTHAHAHAPARLPQHDIPALKDRLLIPEVWQALGLPGQPGARCRSPFRPDKTPSFSLYDGGRRWKDFATNEGGDVIDFIATARQTTTAQALRLFLDLAGVPLPLPPSQPQPRPATPLKLNLKDTIITAADLHRCPTHLLKSTFLKGPATIPAPAQPQALTLGEMGGMGATGPILPIPPPDHPKPTPHSPQAFSNPGPTAANHTPETKNREPAAAATTTATTPTAPSPGTVHVTHNRGTRADWEQVAQTRRLTPEAVSLALALGTLTFGTVQGFPCWILTDAEQRIAEARRVDGLPFPAAGPLAERKAHTLRGSSKSWPVGAGVLRRVPDFRTLLLVEGGPDYLAALHFAHEMERWDVLPVAILGRSTASQIDPAALELMRGRRVRLYPHADADGGGARSARVWATQLLKAGCRVDLFSFAELRRTDGKPINDLNDCTEALDEESTQHLWQGLFPKPDLEVHPPF